MKYIALLNITAKLPHNNQAKQELSLTGALDFMHFEVHGAPLQRNHLLSPLPVLRGEGEWGASVMGDS